MKDAKFALGLAAQLLVPVQLIRARQESQILEQKSGDEYREYRKKTRF